MKWFSENVLPTEVNKKEVKMNKQVYLSLSVFDISKIAVYEYWYDYMKPNYGDNAKLCYMDTDIFIVHGNLKMSSKSLLKMFKQDLAQLWSQQATTHWQNKKNSRSSEGWIGWKSSKGKCSWKTQDIQLSYRAATLQKMIMLTRHQRAQRRV